MKGIRRNTDKVRCPLCWGEDEVKHILLDCMESRNWRTKFLNDKWLKGMDKIMETLDIIGIKLLVLAVQRTLVEIIFRYSFVCVCVYAG